MGAWAPLVGAVLAAGCALRARHRGRARRLLRRVRQLQAEDGGAASPSNLYELLGVSPRADADALKRAYLSKQKLFHPDIVGPEGTEVSALLNDAYALLGDPKQRAAYDEALQLTEGDDAPLRGLDDAGPTWTRDPKMLSRGPDRPVQWAGTPRSRSLWDRVPAEDRGERWRAQQFLYVNEWNCIACFNCADIAPKSFTIDAEQGRARVFAQWGQSEEDLDWAVQSCPVDCIMWVSRQELQALEHVTVAYMHDLGHFARLPRGVDPFALATEWLRTGRQRSKALESRQNRVTVKSVRNIQERMRTIFRQLPTEFRQAPGAAEA